MATVTMKQMLESGIHFGHQTRRWNPKMGRYIFGERHGIYIIDLQKTLRQLQRAYVTVRDVTAQGGKILFVGTKKQAREPVQREAERCGMYFVNHRWLGGTLTNWETIQNSIKTLIDLEEMETSGKIEQFTKKEAIQMRKHREKLDKNLCGIKEMGGVPELMFIVDTHRETIAVKEASRLKIPSIGICDTNSDPDSVTIPIPGNDDAIRAVNLFCTIIADAAIEGRGHFEKRQAEEEAKQAAATGGDITQSSALAKQQDKAGEDGEQGDSSEIETEGNGADRAEATSLKEAEEQAAAPAAEVDSPEA